MIDSIKSHLTIIVILTLIVINFVLFWPVQNHEFIDYDVYDYIIDNSNVSSGITYKGIIRAFTSTHAGNWHPMTWLSHMADCELYGLNPKGHHFNNLLLHAVNTILLFIILMRMTDAIWKSAFVAALFAIHPLHVESVAWVAERKDVLSTFFMILSIGAYILYVENRGTIRYLTIILLFALGLMAKPMLVTLPFLLFLLDYWPLQRLDFNKPGENNKAYNSTVDHDPRKRLLF
ncbi:MAG: glycosyltransferase family 39 protein, partial [Deltaproteobacteria bacterium]|nr:glycosyltransferase family 39 protein [Deltaproteobacteria bacterium]